MGVEHEFQLSNQLQWLHTNSGLCGPDGRPRCRRADREDLAKPAPGSGHPMPQSANGSERAYVADNCALTPPLRRGRDDEVRQFRRMRRRIT
jgi:hypothetical protein